MSRTLACFFLVLLWSCVAGAPADPPGYWTAAQADAILDKTLRIDLAPDLSHLSASERRALPHLLSAGRRLHDLYLQQKHHRSLQALDDLRRLSVEVMAPSTRTRLLDLFRLAKGPIITTLDNERVAFLPVAPEIPGRNVYPLDLTERELDDFLERNEGQREAMLAERTVVRRFSTDLVHQALATLDKYPVLDTLHAGLRERLENRQPDMDHPAFLALPYAVEYADTLVAAYHDLNQAATQMDESDADFAAYLRNRARDLLSNHYESGDASWVTGQFGNLNAQIGSYETYDDKLYGVKTFFSLSVLARDEEKSRKLEAEVGVIQEIEDRLPYDMRKRVRNNIPVGVYNVIADFGQSRSGNTATILPNDANYSRKYGRTILLRYNIITHPEAFANARSRFAAATAPEFHAHLTSEARFNRTLFHEIGHYLGVDNTRDGRSLDVALGRYSDHLEEMKSDLVSLYAADALLKSGYYSTDMHRSVYSAGISRTLQVVEPRRHQPYQTMQLMQFNFFLEHGVLSVGKDGRLSIDYERFHAAVRRLLSDVLTIQASGSPERATELVERWGYWQEELHGALAQRMRDAVRYRYTLMGYAALRSTQ